MLSPYAIPYAIAILLSYRQPVARPRSFSMGDLQGNMLPNAGLIPAFTTPYSNIRRSSAPPYGALNAY